MRHRCHHAWLVVALIAGAAAPPPRMADHLLAGPARPAHAGTPKKNLTFRGRNRIGSPVGVERAQAATCRVAPVARRPDRPPAPDHTRTHPTDRFARPRPAAPLPFRLRC